MANKARVTIARGNHWRYAITATSACGKYSLNALGDTYQEGLAMLGQIVKACPLTAERIFSPAF